MYAFCSFAPPVVSVQLATITPNPVQVTEASAWLFDAELLDFEDIAGASV
jgi:hypothetical protein